MRLTKHTDYAFRVLIYLASNNNKQSTISEISEEFTISKTHVMKVVNELANIGWINSVRGKNGGITLGMKPDEIILKDVVVQMEKTLNPVNCSEPICFINSVCQLKPLLVEAQDKFLTHLEQYTLSDLINKPTIAKLS